jgi:hypothetical protein
VTWQVSVPRLCVRPSVRCFSFVFTFVFLFKVGVVQMNKQVRVETLEVGQGGGFTVAVVGSIPFIAPIGAQLAPHQAAALQHAAGLIAIGADHPAASIVAHVERQLGVSQELHIAGVLAAEAAMGARRSAAADARSLAEVERAAALLAPIRRRPLTDAAQMSLDAAAAHRVEAIAATKSKDHRRAKAALTSARKQELRAANAQRVVLDAVWIEGAEAETVALRAAHGEELVKPSGAEFEEGMAPRFSVRDGLEALFDAGAITALQEKAGRSYRRMREDAPQRLRSQMAAPEGGPGGDPEWGRIRAGFLRAKAGVVLTRVEFEVTRRGRRELDVLRWVAGSGGSINALSASGHQRKLNTEALRAALDVAATVIWNMGLRIAGN